MCVWLLAGLVATSVARRRRAKAHYNVLLVWRLLSAVRNSLLLLLLRVAVTLRLQRKEKMLGGRRLRGGVAFVR